MEHCIVYILLLIVKNVNYMGAGGHFYYLIITWAMWLHRKALNLSVFDKDALLFQLTFLKQGHRCCCHAAGLPLRSYYPLNQSWWAVLQLPENWHPQFLKAWDQYLITWILFLSFFFLRLLFLFAPESVWRVQIPKILEMSLLFQMRETDTGSFVSSHHFRVIFVECRWY